MFAHTGSVISHMSDLREKRVELILQQLEDVPALSDTTAMVARVAAQNAAAVADAVTRVAGDQALSDRVLQLLIACGEQAESVDRVVVRRGFDTLRLATIAVGVYAAFASAERV